MRRANLCERGFDTAISFLYESFDGRKDRPARSPSKTGPYITHLIGDLVIFTYIIESFKLSEKQYINRWSLARRHPSSFARFPFIHPLPTMTEDSEFVNVRMRRDELNKLSEAAESVFGDSSRISYGAMVRYLASDYVEESN